MAVITHAALRMRRAMARSAGDREVDQAATKAAITT